MNKRLADTPTCRDTYRETKQNDISLVFQAEQQKVNQIFIFIYLFFGRRGRKVEFQEYKIRTVWMASATAGG